MQAGCQVCVGVITPMRLRGRKSRTSAHARSLVMTWDGRPPDGVASGTLRPSPEALREYAPRRREWLPPSWRGPPYRSCAAAARTPRAASASIGRKSRYSRIARVLRLVDAPIFIQDLTKGVHRRNIACRQSCSGPTARPVPAQIARMHVRSPLTRAPKANMVRCLNRCAA
jgi:hypothetical protein